MVGLITRPIALIRLKNDLTYDATLDVVNDCFQMGSVQFIASILIVLQQVSYQNMYPIWNLFETFLHLKYIKKSN